MITGFLANKQSRQDCNEEKKKKTNLTKKPQTNKPAICKADMCLRLSEEALSLEVLTGQTYIKQTPFIITAKVPHLNLKCPSLEE